MRGIFCLREPRAAAHAIHNAPPMHARTGPKSVSPHAGPYFWLVSSPTRIG